MCCSGIERIASVSVTQVAVFAVLLTGTLFSPGFTQAQTPTLPQQMCDPVSLEQFTPHIYESELQSFDYIIRAQGRHLPFSVEINGTPIPLEMVTTWAANPGALRVHVDVPTHISRTAATVNVSTLQITNGPPPICVTSAEFGVSLPPVAQQAAPGKAEISPETPGSGFTQNVPPSTEQDQGAPTQQIPPTVTLETTSETQNATTGEATSTPAMVPSGMCKSTSQTMWIVLALVDAVIALLVIINMPMIVKINERLSVAVLAPFLIFLAIWYFFDGCREHIWFPAAILIIAIVVLLYSTQDSTKKPEKQGKSGVSSTGGGVIQLAAPKKESDEGETKKKQGGSGGTPSNKGE